MVDGRYRIGDEVYVHGYIDEIRGETVIIRNKGGYFGTLDDEVYVYEASEDTMTAVADRKTEPYEYEIKALHKDYVEPYVKIEDEPQTETKTETQNSNLTFEKVMEEIQTQVIEFPDTHQKFVFTRKIEMDGDSIKICGWEYKGVKDGESEGE